MLYPGKASQNGACFLVNIARERKPRTGEKNPVEATCSPPPLCPQAVTHCRWGLESESLTGLLKNLELVLQQRVLPQEPAKEGL